MPRSLVPNQFDYAGIYVEGERSIFRFNKPHSASFMSGMLVPFGDPIPFFPGTKADLKLNAVIRSATMVIPPIDGIYVDFFTAWIPHRIVWNSFPQFMGENDTTAWTQALSLVYPYVEYHESSNTINSVLYRDDNLFDKSTVLGNFFLDVHYGLYCRREVTSSMAIYGKHINVLAHRGYYSFWNHFVRDENYQRPVLFSKGNSGSAGEFGYFLRAYELGEIFDDGGNYKYYFNDLFDASIGDGQVAGDGALLMPVNKFHDWATSLLPQPQFGDAVEFSLASDTAPIMVTNTSAGTLLGKNSELGFFNTADLVPGTPVQIGVNAPDASYYGGRLIADLSQATAITVNQFRTSVMYQRYLEALARGGRRVPEYYNVIYGVKNSEAKKDYPEMLSHSRYVLGVTQVVAQSDASGDGWTSHLGDTGAFSLTNLRGIPSCEKEFSEFGYLHIFYCVRAANRYSQATPPHFFRQTLMDEYNPYFDHIGDVAVPNYLINNEAYIESNFGYQEAWYDIRSQIGLTVGALNKAYGSLAYWTLGEVFDSSLITCTPGYICFAPETFNDLFIATYCNYPQFILDGLIYGRVAGRISPHSIPGIVGRI